MSPVRDVIFAAGSHPKWYAEGLQLAKSAEASIFTSIQIPGSLSAWLAATRSGDEGCSGAKARAARSTPRTEVSLSTKEGRCEHEVHI